MTTPLILMFFEATAKERILSQLIAINALDRFKQANTTFAITSIYYLSINFSYNILL